MRIVEGMLWIVAGIGVVMKVFHIPLANFLFIISMSTLMMLYFFLSWLLLPTPTRKDQSIGLSILAGIAMTFLIEGILFKVQAWPLATFNVLLGLGLGGITAIVTLLITRNRPELLSYNRAIMVRLVPLMLCAALLFPVSARSMMHFHNREASAAKLELIDRLYSTEEPEARERLRQQLDSLDVEESKAEHLQQN